MRRSEFGKLIAALRQEHLDEYGKPWTQQHLGQKTGLGKITIGKIERGQRGYIEEDTLLRLAEALQLTSGERQAFFEAASGVSSEQIVRMENEPRAAIARLMRIIEQLSLPAFVVDAYYDLVAFNLLLGGLYGFTETEARSLFEQYNERNFNMLTLFFSPIFEEKVQTKMGSRWQDVVYRNVMHFRTTSLPYRHKPYFQHLLAELGQYPQFRQCWQTVYFQEKDYFMQGDYFPLQSPTGEALQFITPLSKVITQQGLFHLFVYVPISGNARKMVNDLAAQMKPTVFSLPLRLEKFRAREED